MNSIPLRHCNKCGNDWPSTLDYFFADKRTGSGFRSPCKQCIKEYRVNTKDEIAATRKKHYAAHSEKIKQYVRAYQIEHQEEVRSSKRRHYALHQEEYRHRARTYRAQHLEARRAYDRHYRNLHREEHRQHNQRYYRKMYALHPEKFRQYAHRHYIKYQERLRRYGRQYHYLHRAQRLRYAHYYDATHKEEKRQYEANHKEERLNYSRQYRNLHRTEERARVRQRRALKKAIPGILTPQQIQEKLKRQRYRCYYAACGFAKFERRKGQYVYHIEHTIPISRTEAHPRHDVNYIVLSCPSCNHRKQAKLPHEWPEGGRLM